MSAQEKATHLVTPMKDLILATVGADGLPNARILSSLGSEGLRTVWMISGRSSVKCRELTHNNHCLLYAADAGNPANFLELRLRGTMALLTDSEIRSRMWREEYRPHFPGGKDDPELCVLQFTTTSGTIQTLAGTEQVSV